MRGRRRTHRPDPARSQATPRPPARLAWGLAAELRLNRAGQIHEAQRARIKKISIFDPWLRLLLGVFLLVFGATQRIDTWQGWLPLLLSAPPLLSAAHSFLIRRRLDAAGVEVVEGELDAVRTHRSDAVAATLHRAGHYMLLVSHDGAGPLPQPGQPYRFYAVFDVIRPPLVVAIESLEEEAHA
jgi:hypothetical protein